MFSGAGVPALPGVHRTRTVSSPVPGPYPGQPPIAPSPSPTLSRPLSPGLNYGERRESGGPLPISINDFTPPAALARFHSALPQGSFLPSPSPQGGGGGPRSLPPRPHPEAREPYTPGPGISRPEKFARPGAPISISTSPSSALSTTTPPISPNIKDTGGQSRQPPPSPSPMDINLA